MKKRNFLKGIAVCLVLAGCGEASKPFGSGFELTSADEAYRMATLKASRRNSAAFPVRIDENKSPVPITTPLAPVVTKAHFRELVQFNHLVANEFLLAADHSRKLGKSANAALILTAVLYGVGNSNGVNSDTLKNGLIAGLGLSEVIQYSGSNASSSAFLAAAEQSGCIAARGATKLDNGATETDANELWEAMLSVQADLRRNLRRKPVSFVELATGLLDPKEHKTESYELSRAKQRLRAHEKQKAIKKKDGTPDTAALRYQLLDCLALETAGDS